MGLGKEAKRVKEVRHIAAQKHPCVMTLKLIVYDDPELLDLQRNPVISHSIDRSARTTMPDRGAVLLTTQNPLRTDSISFPATDSIH